MIKSFRHKGLREFFGSGIMRGIMPQHASRLARVLDRLAASLHPSDMGLPGYELHELTGKEKGTWSVSISDNWRATFGFEGENAVDVDCRDYHCEGGQR